MRSYMYPLPGKILLEDKVENLKSNVRKIQVAFRGSIPEEVKNNPHILKIESVGKIHHIVVKDSLEKVMEEIQKYHPIILETVDMTLEEIFVYKMGEKVMNSKILTFNKALLKKDWKMTRALCFVLAGILFFTMTLGDQHPPQFSMDIAGSSRASRPL